LGLRRGAAMGVGLRAWGCDATWAASVGSRWAWGRDERGAAMMSVGLRAWGWRAWGRERGTLRA
jgi:hypothetical protein